jgi:uncharacterized membrane-anchored protein YjiN (DUF445 family)
MDKVFYWGGVFFLSVFGLSVAFGLFWEMHKWVTRRQHFIRLFVPQKVVSDRLRDLADNLRHLFDEQIRSQTREEKSSLSSREKADDEIKKRIAGVKEEFWEHVLLARDLGFMVPRTIDEALAGRRVSPELAALSQTTKRQALSRQ